MIRKLKKLAMVIGLIVGLSPAVTMIVGAVHFWDKIVFVVGVVDPENVAEWAKKTQQINANTKRIEKLEGG